MHQPSQSRSRSRARPSAEAPAVEFLAEVLIDRELPLDSAVDLTIIDLTERAGTDTGGIDHTRDHDRGHDHVVGVGWGLFDGTSVGRVVTPDHVLAARSAYRRVADGRPLGSVGTVYLSVSGFADDYLSRCVFGNDRTVVANDTATDRAAMIRRARHRLEHFLGLTDEDFLACFRFNGEITGEYLQQVGRCDQRRAASVSERVEPVPEPSPGQRRRRKSRSLRTI